MRACHTARSADSVLVLIHLQTRLFAAMPAAAARQLRCTARALLAAAGELGIPVIVAEQNPAGLGRTDPDIAPALPAAACRIETDWFDACAHPQFSDALEITGRRQVVVCGMEAHVCVLQTAAGLSALDYQVFVVEDGVCSRSAGHRDNALGRLTELGAVLTNVESTLFEWLGRYRHPAFQAVTAPLHELD